MTGKQLKNAILQLAIQGKLVPQDPTDEPASVLLAQIHKEKEQLVKAGKLKKKDLATTPISDDEKPFEIPESWEWVRLGKIGIFERGNGIKRDETFSSGKPCVRYGEMYTKYRYNPTFDKTFSYTSPAVFNKCRKAHNGDLFMALTGENKQDIALAAQYTGNEEIAVGGDLCHFSILQAYALYFVYVINSQFFSDKKELLATGDIIVHISADKLGSIPIPLPPLPEQHRIVAKIEELMPLVEEYGVAQEKLNRLNEALPEALKKSILQQAIQGKLVPQDANDEPASVLLAQIRKEKEQLVKAGKLKKKDLETTPITDEEKPFEIPESWEWVRLGDILLSLTDGTHSTPHYTTAGIPFLSVKDMSSGTISFDRTKFISEEEHSDLIKRCNPQKGDILLSKVGTTGIPVKIDTDIPFSIFVSLALLKFNNTFLYADFLVYLISSPLVQLQVQENTRGVGNKNWVLNDIANTIIPLPPLSEQHRIVDLLDAEFAKIDALKANAEKNLQNARKPRKFSGAEPTSLRRKYRLSTSRLRTFRQQTLLSGRG